MTEPKKTRHVVKVNAMSQARLIKLLIQGGRSCRELAEATGLHYVTVLQYTRELHKAGAVHIHEWQQDAHGRDMIKIYRITTAAREHDATRYRITDSDKGRRYRESCKLRRAQQAMTFTTWPPAQQPNQESL